MIDLDATDLIADFATGAYAVTRRSAATYSNGIAVPGATSVSVINAAVVPTQARELQRLPEGRRSVETRTVYTVAPLLVGSQGGPYEADLIQIEGVQWEVQSVGAWPSAEGFYVALVQRPG